MTLYASTRLTTHLNALSAGRLSLDAAVAGTIADDVAHHVLDPDEVLGLDPLRATPLATAFPLLAATTTSLWILTLPVPGRLGALRGPTALNGAALETGSAVVASNGGVALVPYVVGRAVQWRAFAAERPFAPPSPYDAERVLSETVLSTGRTLSRLDVAGGRRPGDVGLPLAPGYPPRQRVAADRSARLLLACDVALTEDGTSISSYEIGVRDHELRRLRDAAADGLCSAVSWLRD